MSGADKHEERVCPLCGGDNGCAMAAADGAVGPCWCEGVTFSQALLDSLPPAQVGRTCICRGCQERQAT